MKSEQLKYTFFNLPESVITDKYPSIEAVNYKSRHHELYVSIKTRSHDTQIIFPNTVVYKVFTNDILFSEIFRCNAVWVNDIDHALVSRVESGGWLDRDSYLKEMISFNCHTSEEVHEYVISGDYECLSTISCPPKFNAIPKS